MRYQRLLHSRVLLRAIFIISIFLCLSGDNHKNCCEEADMNSMAIVSEARDLEEEYQTECYSPFIPTILFDNQNDLHILSNAGSCYQGKHADSRNIHHNKIYLVYQYLNELYFSQLDENLKEISRHFISNSSYVNALDCAMHREGEVAVVWTEVKDGKGFLKLGYFK